MWVAVVVFVLRRRGLTSAKASFSLSHRFACLRLATQCLRVLFGVPSVVRGWLRLKRPYDMGLGVFDAFDFERQEQSQSAAASI